MYAGNFSFNKSVIIDISISLNSVPEIAKSISCEFKSLLSSKKSDNFLNVKALKPLSVYFLSSSLLGLKL